MRLSVATAHENARGTVVIVGGGPIGLWTAAQTRIRCPRARVVVLEKYAEYGRRHVLRLEPRSLVTPLSGVDARLAGFCSGLTPIVRTQDLELRLSELAQAVGVEILKKREVVDLNDGSLLAEFGDSAGGLVAIVGADGAHSVVRKSLFADAMSTYEEVMYACELKYESAGESRALAPLSEAYPTLKLMDHAAQEYVGHAREGRTPVTLRIIVRAGEFIEMSGASFKKPWRLSLEEDRSRVPASVLRSITIWLNARRELAGEQRIPGSELLSVTSLAPYRSAAFVRHRAVGQSVPSLLVGDAAFGVPFFRSANNGFLCGTRAAECLAQLLAFPEEELNRRQALERYTGFVEGLASREIRTARRKRTMLQTAQWWCHISGLVPWQLNRWSSAEQSKFALPIRWME